jgi:hypothetical protein
MTTLPGPVSVGPTGAGGGAGACVVTAPREGSWHGAVADGCREARAKVTQLAVQGCHLLQMDWSLGVAHLFSH